MEERQAAVERAEEEERRDKREEEAPKPSKVVLYLKTHCYAFATSHFLATICP